MKRCSQCRLDKPFSEFHRAPYGKGKVQACCKACKKALDAKRYAEHPEKFAASFKRWSEKNKAHDLARSKKWRSLNRERHLRLVKEWQRAHPEKMRLYDKVKRQRHFARIKAYMKVYGREWVKRNPEKQRERISRYRARKANAPINDLTAAQWAMLKERYNFSCAYCGERVPVLTQDHVLALSRGGNHTMANVVPACKSCNSRKHTTPVEEFLKGQEA